MYTQNLVETPVAQSVIDEGLRFGMHFAIFDPEKHVGWRKEHLREDSQYTKKPLIRQRMQVVEIVCPQVEWYVWHEPPKSAPEPKPAVKRRVPFPLAPERPVTDPRRGGMPIGVIGVLAAL